MSTELTAALHAPMRRLRSRNDMANLVELIPSGLDLVSRGNLARQTVTLAANAANTRRFATLLGRTQSRLREVSIPVLVQERRRERVAHGDLSRSYRRWLGQVALEVYFEQLFRAEEAIIDLWPSRFGVDPAGDAVWSPRPFYLRWDPDFREDICDMYAGFFLGDKDRFDIGVLALGLSDSVGAMIEHLGSGTQRGVRFEGVRLRRTLTRVAATKKGDDRRLHPNFMAFGFYLMGLYELLESLDSAFDVRAAFMRTYPGNSQR